MSAASISSSDIVSIIKESLPAKTSTLIIPLLTSDGVDYNIWILIISALLLVSKGSRSIMRVASTIYGTKDKVDLKSTLKSYVLSIILILLFAFLIIIPVLGLRILMFLSNIKALSFITGNLIKIFSILRWPISLIIIYVNLKIIYIYSPNKKIPHNSVNKGTLFTSILWMLSTALYSFYITHLTKYNIFYGGASNLIILMLWVYLICYIFVLGMSINASYLKNQSDLQ